MLSIRIAPALSLTEANDDNTAYLVEVETRKNWKSGLRSTAKSCSRANSMAGATTRSCGRRFARSTCCEVVRLRPSLGVMDTGGAPLYDDEEYENTPAA